MLRNGRLLSLGVAISCALSLPVYADITINPGEDFNNTGFLENFDVIDNYGYFRNEGDIFSYSYYYPYTNTQINNWGMVDNLGQIILGDNASLNNFGEFNNATFGYINLQYNSSVFNSGTFNNHGDVVADYYYPNEPAFINTGTVNNFAGLVTNISNSGSINNQNTIISNVIVNQVSGIIDNVVAASITIYENMTNSGSINNNGDLQLHSISEQSVTFTNSGVLNNSGVFELFDYASGAGGVTVINSGDLTNMGSLNLGTSNLSINNTGNITNYGQIQSFFSNVNEVFNNAGHFYNHGTVLSSSMNVINSGVFENNSGVDVRIFSNLTSGIFYNQFGFTRVNHMDNEGVVNNDETIGLYSIYDYGLMRAILNNSAEFNNRGSLYLEYDSQAVINNFGIFNQQGTIDNQSDNIVFNNYGSFDDSMGWGELNLRNNSSLNNHGTYNNWNGVNGASSSSLYNTGTFNSPGQIRDMGVIRNAGIMNFGSDVNTLNFRNTSTGVINNNAVAWSWYNGMTVDGEFNNQGVINNGFDSRLTLNGYQEAANSGTINNDEGAEIHSNSDFNNSGTINNKRNALVNLNGMTSTNSGVINNDGVVNAYMGLNSSGVIAGNGEYYVSSGMYGMVITEAGTLAPGKSTGDEFGFGFDDKTLDIFGDLSLDGTLAIDFDWYYAGMNDVVNVYGNVMLGANSVLDISFLGDNYFFLGQSFDLMFANDIIGDFGGFYYDALFDNSLALQWEIFNEYGQDILRVSVVSAVPLPAAVWMFMSGMVGLMVMGRRRKLKLH